MIADFNADSEIARQRRENIRDTQQRIVIMGDGKGRDPAVNLYADKQRVWVRDVVGGNSASGYTTAGLAYAVLAGSGPTPQFDKLVHLEYETSVGEYRVKFSDPDYMDAVGQSMHLENASDPHNQFHRTEQLLPLRAQWIGGGKISVQGYAYTYNGIGYQFPGTDEDTHILAADEAPAAGEQCYILLVYNYALYAANTFPIKFYLSTPIDSVTETLSLDDLNECIAQMDRTVEREIAAFRLSGDVTDYYGHRDDRDRREWLNTPLEIPGGYITTDMIADGAITTPKLSVFAFKVSTTTPTINDDSGDGYSVGSYWFNKTTGILYVASDVTVGNAVWTPVAGSGAAPSSATYLVQTANAGLPNAQAMAALGTGLVKNTTAMGVQTIAIAGTDYTSPTGAENLSNKAITASTVNSTPIGATTPSTGAFTNLSALVTDAATNTTTNVFTLGHESSGTPAASFGTGLLFQGESSTTSARDMGRVRTVWTTATDASRVANMIFSANNASGEVDMLTVSPTAVSVAAFLDMPALAAGAGAIRFRAGSTNHNRFYHDGTNFLMLNSTGQMQFRNSANAEVNFFTNDIARFRIDGSGNISLANTSISPSVQLGVTNTSALTNTLLNIMTINHNTSGTPAASFGETVAFNLQSSTTANRAAGAIDVLWDTATDASRASAMVLNVYSVTTKQPFIKAIGDASGVKIGLNGATPVARSTYGAPTGVLTRTTFDPSTVTLSQLAERVAAMITDFRSRGDFA